MHGRDGRDLPPETSLFVYPLSVKDTSFLRGETTTETMTTTSSFRYDTKGNPIKTTVETLAADGERYQKTTENEYGDDGSLEQRLGKATKVTVMTQRLAPQDENNLVRTHVSEFEYGTVNSYIFQLSTFWPVNLTTLGLKTKKLEAGRLWPLEMWTLYGYDRFGNVIKTTDCSNDFGSCIPGATGPAPSTDPQHPPFRITRTSYDPADFNQPSGLVTTLDYDEKGRFPVKTTNALGHHEFFAYEGARGLLRQKTGPNGIHTCYEYDDLGHQTAEIARCNSPHPIRTLVNQYWATGSDVPFAQVVTITQPPTGATTWVFTDAFGKTLDTRSRSFDGGFTQSTIIYDTLGRPIITTKPRLMTDPQYETLTEYDDLGRVEHVTSYLGQIDGTSSNAVDIIDTSYEGSIIKTSHTVNGVSDLRRRWEKKNALGKTAWVEDDLGVKILYDYDADGNLTHAGDRLGNSVPTVQNTYDLRGRKTVTTDPDLGTWTYEYDGFGNLIAQTDAKAHRTEMSYDQLGRMLTKKDGQDTAEWVYDVAPGAGVGKLAAMVSAPDDRLGGSPCVVPIQLQAAVGGKRTARWFDYTSLGDLQEEFQCTDGETFSTQHTYDDFGRQQLVVYPEVNGARMNVEYNYARFGHLHYLRDPATGIVYWAATAMNALGQVTKERTANGVETISTRNASTGWLMGSSATAHGDGNKLIQNWQYQFDVYGNLAWRGRSDEVAAAPSEETFTYDELHRLKTSQVSIPSQNYVATETFFYDSLGNLTAKGTADSLYTYGTGCAPGGRVGPHAVCTIPGSAPFQYDDNGNMTVGKDRAVAYNFANKPTQIATGSTSVDFVYDADGNRVVQLTEASGGTSSERTVYVGLGGTGKSLYERTTRGTTTEHVQFLYAGASHGGSAFALRVVKQEGDNSAPQEATKYYHLDHLGSVTAMSDEQGHVIDASWGGPDAGVMGYDPWGARRSPDGHAADPATFNLQVGHREFTGHETIPGVGLINMNGRVYDPVLGRFLSPDPTVQFPSDLQSYNRYSYVLNNPLRYSDPTGYSLFGNSWVDMGVGFAIGLGASAACVGTGGAGCAALMVLASWYSTTTMIVSGASVDQVIGGAVIGILAGQAGGMLGGAAVQAFGGNAVGQILGGAVAGAASTAFAEVLTPEVISAGRTFSWVPVRERQPRLLVGSRRKRIR